MKQLLSFSPTRSIQTHRNFAQPNATTGHKVALRCAGCGTNVVSTGQQSIQKELPENQIDNSIYLNQCRQAVALVALVAPLFKGATNTGENDDYFEEDEFRPCDECDLPDACADFGCAIKQGIREYPRW